MIAASILILLCTVVILVLNILTWRGTRKLSKTIEESRKRVEIVAKFDNSPPAHPRPPHIPPRPMPREDEINPGRKA